MKATVQYLRRNSLSVVAILIAMLAVSGTSIAISRDSGGQTELTSATVGGKLYACIAGFHRTLNYATANTVCPRGQRKISWTKKGSSGPRGKQGLRGAMGPKGIAGAAGTTGDTGPPGPAGSDGATGIAGPPGPSGPVGDAGPQGPVSPMFLTGRINNVPGDCEWCDVYSYGAFSGTADAVQTNDWNVARSNVTQMSPPIDLHATELSVYQIPQPPGGNREFRLVVNGTPTDLLCKPGAGVSDCSVDSNPGVLVPARSIIALKMTGHTGTAANPPTDVMVSLRLDE